MYSAKIGAHARKRSRGQTFRFLRRDTASVLRRFEMKKAPNRGKFIETRA